MIFGKKGCNENRDWKVRVCFMQEEDYLDIIEQVNEKEARKVFEQFKKEMGDKNSIIEVKTQNREWILNKSHIQNFCLYKY